MPEELTLDPSKKDKSQEPFSLPIEGNARLQVLCAYNDLSNRRSTPFESM